MCVCFPLSFNGLAGCASFLRVVEARLSVIQVVICAPVFLHVLGSSLMIRERNTPLSERRSDVTGACTRVLFSIAAPLHARQRDTVACGDRVGNLFSIRMKAKLSCAPACPFFFFFLLPTR